MDKQIKNLTKGIINSQSNALSSEICSKLHHARQRALSKSTKKSFYFTAWYVPVTAMAVLAIYFILPISQTPIQQPAINVIQQMEIAEQFELMEDLEFYEWLSQTEDTSSI